MSRGPRSPRRRRWLFIGSALLVSTGALWWWASSRLDPDRLWDEAQSALHAGLPRGAATNLAWIYRLRSPTPRDRMLEAQIAAANHQPEEALAALGSIPRDDPFAVQASLLGGRLERERKHLHAAEEYYRRALAADPSLIAAHRELIYIYGIQSRSPEIDAEFRALSRLTELNHHDLFTWAFTQFSPFRPDDAKILRAFVEADPDDRYSRLALAEIGLSEGASPDEFDRLLAELPDSDPDVLATRAKIAFTHGRHQEAEAFLARGPSDHGSLNRLRGKLAVHRRENDAAVEFYRKAMLAQPYDRMTTLEFGQALALKGEKEAAATYLERAKRLSDAYNIIHQIRSSERENDSKDPIRIARAFELAGLVEQARQWIELSVRRDPLDAEAQRVLRRIQAIEQRTTSVTPPGKSRE